MKVFFEEDFFEDSEKVKKERLSKTLFWLAMLVNAIVIASILYLHSRGKL